MAPITSPTILEQRFLLHSTSLLRKLAKLNHLIDEQNFLVYWQQGVATLYRHLSADAISLLLFDAGPELPKTPIRIGQITAATAKAFDVWETKLRHSTPSTSAASSGALHRTSINTNDEHPFIHINITINQIVRGALTILSNRNSPLTEEEFEELNDLVQLFAGNGLRSKYLQNTREQLERVSFLYQVTQAITSTLDLADVLNQTTQMATFVLNAQASTLYRISKQNHELVFMFTQGKAADELVEKRMPIDKGVAGWVATHGKPLLVNDVSKTHLHNPDVDSQTGFKTRSILCVPLRIHDRTVGVLQVLNKENSAGFTVDDETWLTVMGQQVAIALENAQLYQDLRIEQERIIKVQEEVRHQLARDLHDNTAQMLSLIIMNLDLSRQLLQENKLTETRQEIDQIEELARQANREIRTLLFELHPIILESRGLIPAVESYTAQLNQSMDAQVHLNADLPDLTITPSAASSVFSIIQEAVNNIRRHANAQNITIFLSANAENLIFSVSDDGNGFDYEQTMQNYDSLGSFGLLNMQERATLLGGSLSICSPRPNKQNGTELSGEIPLINLEEENDNSSPILNV